MQEAPGADFVPSVVAAAMGLGDSEEGGCPMRCGLHVCAADVVNCVPVLHPSETSSSAAGLEDKSECMACVAPAAGFPAFLIFVTGLGRDTLNILFTMIILRCVVLSCRGIQCSLYSLTTITFKRSGGTEIGPLASRL